MLGQLLEVPRLRALIPFVRTAYAQPTSYEWEDQQGSRHQIWQHEGGEQGDPLMPLLCLAVHNPLTAIQNQLRPGEHVFAFLDDIYVVSLPERTRAIFNLVAEKLGAGARVELVACRQDPGVEPGGRLSSRHGGTGSRCVECCRN